MIAPFDVDIRVLDEQIENLFRGRTAVEDVAHDVQTVDRQPLDQQRHRDDKVVGVDLYDGLEDVVVVAHLILILVGLGVEELIDDIGVVGRGRLAHLGARVFGRQVARELQHQLEGVSVPFAVDVCFLFQQAELLLGVIDQGA